MAKLDSPRRAPLSVEHRNVVPGYKKSGGRWKEKDCPRFIPLSEALAQWNRSEEPVKGRWCSLEVDSKES